MKVGIVVVYLVHERDEKLLDLHLSQIERHTQVPYTIYGSVNRLLPKFREKLERHPRVRICSCRTIDGRGSAEHAFYLDQLINYAMADGVSHIAILHVDSFPIRSGWIDALAGKLSDSCVLAAVMRHRLYDQKPSTIGFFFHRDFYLNYRPAFLISEAERVSPPYKRYAQAFEFIEDSGSGYGFKLFTEGLPWYPLVDTSNGEARNSIGSIYGDLIFHLGGAVHYGERHRQRVFDRLGWASLQPLKEAIRPVVPRPLRKYLARHDRLLAVLEPINNQTFEQFRERLFEDPETFLNHLRAGKWEGSLHEKENNRCRAPSDLR